MNKYITHELQQGSQEWLAYRANTLNASDAGTVLGLNPYKTRADLIKEMAIGFTKEIDAGTQRRFDNGHRFERLCMPIAEDIIGEPLSSTTVSMEVPGLTRRLSASLDGATFGDTENVEHKTLTESLAVALDRGELPEQYPPQMEQGMMITGATRCLFIASKWDDNDNLVAEKHLWYDSNPALRANIIAAWKQAEADAAAYQHTEAAPVAVAAPINELPALMVEITGAVTASNLTQWKAVVTERIAGINTNLQSDDDFANADAMVKFLDDGEKRIDLVKSQAQAQASDIDTVFRALDEIKASMRAKRLELDKLVKARKESIRGEIVQEALTKLSSHAGALNKRLGRHYIVASGDFAGAIKGKRTVQSMRDACDSELARSKIIASEQADRIQINLNAYADLAPGHEFLFSDLDALVMKDADGFAAIVTQRIDNHAKAEAERQRIAAERKANAKAELIAKQQRELDAAEDAAIVAKPTEPAAQPAATTTSAENGGYTVAPVAAVAPAHTGITGSAKVLDEIDDLLRGFTLADLIKVRDFAAQIAVQREKAAA